MIESKTVTAALALIKSDPSKLLGLTVGSHEIATPGQEVPRADAQEPPTLSFSVPPSSGPYIVVGLDLDAPFVSASFLGPILHWIQPGLVPQAGSDILTYEGTPFVANYIGPAPPPGSLHRYVFLLFEQPADFDAKKYAPKEGKKMGNWPRMRYDFAKFEKEIKLGPVVAVNYFQSK